MGPKKRIPHMSPKWNLRSYVSAPIVGNSRMALSMTSFGARVILLVDITLATLLGAPMILRIATHGPSTCLFLHAVPAECRFAAESKAVSSSSLLKALKGQGLPITAVLTGNKHFGSREESRMHKLAL